MPVERDRNALKGLAAGVAAGLIASFAMNQFQKVWAKALPIPGDGGDPVTVRAANHAKRAVEGHWLDDQDKEPAGEIAHYLLGAGLGAAYGLAAEYQPKVTSGFGTAFGAGTALLLDEAVVPAAGLSRPPSDYPASTHVYSFVSHLLFGSVTEGVRRLLRTRRNEVR